MKDVEMLSTSELLESDGGDGSHMSRHFAVVE